MKRVKKFQAGFTLVELLCVIVIIALLCALLFAVMKPAREKASEANCMSNLHQIGLAYQMYRQDYGGGDPPSARTLSQLGLPNTVVKLNPYLKNQNVFKCKSEFDPVGRNLKISYQTCFTFDDEDPFVKQYPRVSAFVDHFGLTTPLLLDPYHGGMMYKPIHEILEGDSVFLILCLDGGVRRHTVPNMFGERWLKVKL